MRLFISSLVAVIFAWSAEARAQVLKPADLIGSWVIPQDGKDWADSLRGTLLVDMLTLNADGSYVREMKRRAGDSLVAAWPKPADQDDGGPFHWELAGDTLQLTAGAFNPALYRVTVKSRRLFLWDRTTWGAGLHHENCANLAFDRFDSVQSLTLPPPPPITIQPAELVGTWAGRLDLEGWGTINDTLVIGADYTFRVAHVGPPDDFYVKGTWALLPGDRLKAPGLTIGSTEGIALQNGQLVRCGTNHAVLKRIAP